MKGRMFVVNEQTLITTTSSSVASIIVPPLSGAYWLKTVSDIMADMMQIEIGDYIFLWETRTDTQKSRIHGVYRAISKPYYECSSTKDNAPFKIRIERAYDFQIPLNEYDVLNCPYIKKPLWTIIGKKVAGKSRGTSPLSQEEIQNLITLLIGKNPNYTFFEFDQSRCIAVPNPLHIDCTKQGDNIRPTSFMTLDPNTLNFLNSDGNVHYEKALETILNQELTAKNKSLFQKIGVTTDNVIWFSNYLPYSIEQSEMDYVIIESADGFAIGKIFVIELMRDRIDEAHIHRALMYSKWVNDTLALGVSMVQPILICSNSYDFIGGESDGRKINAYYRLKILIEAAEKEYHTRPLKIYEYDFHSGTMDFTQKR